MSSITATSPFDGRDLGCFACSTQQDIAEQMRNARLAAQQWQQRSVKSRCASLKPLNQLLLAELDSWCELISLTTGKVHTEALLGEIYPLLALNSYYQQHAARILKPRSVFTSPMMFPAATATVEQQGYGVVAVISPWNYPLQLAVAPILTALIAGNAVLLKASELALPIAQRIIELFKQLDLPDNLLQWVIGEAQAGEWLIDARPDLVFFTGGLQAGRAVMQRAAQHPIPVLLELGGKDPMLILEDANIHKACQAALYGAFSNSGQICVATERLYVHQSLYQAVLDNLLTELTQLNVAASAYADVGTLTSPQQFVLLQAHYQDALTKGAQASGPLQREGNLVKPVLLWNVTHEMRVMQEESFGPLLPIMAFKDSAEAVQLANTSEFGLNASIWSNNISKAQTIAKQLQTGNWAINDVIKNIGHPGLPFGGIKNSGFGCYHGAEGLLNFSYPVSGLTNHSRLPKEPNWFPYSQSHYQHFKGYLDFVYGTGSMVQRSRRNQVALQAFRQYSSFNLTQVWHNLGALLSFKRNL